MQHPKESSNQNTDEGAINTEDMVKQHLKDAGWEFSHQTKHQSHVIDHVAEEECEKLYLLVCHVLLAVIISEECVAKKFVIEP